MAGVRRIPILSGIMSLASSNIAVAAVVFIASILVPFTKVIVMFTLLLSIHFKCEQGLRTRILLLRLVTWIGPLVDAGSFRYLVTPCL
ncbi:Paraquat-inducible protein A [Salmonella enterica subsp. arizonae]|uniref:Paraquat-inducible protein A n=1 Tax=Salmonella enterica subsp. arizonae TaxID=59203 RepID=A0A379S497_SALER|nr:Paraquat-inducible protein A [Salmonella enterica subsp. arizonae]